MRVETLVRVETDGCEYYLTRMTRKTQIREQID